MASSENKRELILTRSPGRLMVSLSLPAIVGMVVIGLYTFCLLYTSDAADE